MCLDSKLRTAFRKRSSKKTFLRSIRAQEWAFIKKEYFGLSSVFVIGNFPLISLIIGGPKNVA